MKQPYKNLTELFTPENYQIELEIAPDRRHFIGHEIIVGRKKTEEYIRLHWHNEHQGLAVKVNGLEVHHLQFCDHDEVILNENADGKIAKYHAGQNLTIELCFSGEIIDGSMSGLYPAKYGERELLTTQFESTGARRVFPCVDEPAAKATFDLSITARKDFAKTIVSNQPALSRKNHDDQTTVKFATTPKMSTYLLAFVIGDLQKISRKTTRGVTINVYATPVQNPASLTFAANFAAKAIDFYEQYFGVEYPLSKSDQVAIPDFSAGAMENWGLVTYRESCLLVAPSDSLSQKQYVATVIAHELSHQWFGDLVTMQWWNDLWLNESFANFMENFATDKIYPDWRNWQSYESTDVVAALKRDALPGVQSVREEIDDPDMIDTLFDGAIVYAKGGRMVRMVHALVGDTAWRAALKNYFTEHAYGNTTMNDFWDEIAAVSHLDFSIKAMMENLLTRPGYPVVTAALNDNAEITLSQQRFLITDNDDTTERPFVFPIFANDPTAPRLLRDHSATFTVDDPTNFQLNMGNNSHFITNYTPKLRSSLNRNFAKFDSTDRLKLLNEARILANSANGYLLERELVDMLQPLSLEHNYAVWKIGDCILSDLSQVIDGSSTAESDLKRFVRQIVDPIFLLISQNHNTDNDIKLWLILTSREIWSGNETVIHQYLALFAEHKNDLGSVNGEIRSIVFSNAIKNGDEEEFDFLFDQYKIANDATLRNDIMSGLTVTEKPRQIATILANLSNQSIIRPQDLVSWLALLLSNKYARTDAWRWLRDHWDYIAKVYADDMTFSEFPQIAGAYLKTTTELEEFRNFFTPYRDNPMLKRAIALGENSIASRIQWIARNRDGVVTAIRKK